LNGFNANEVFSAYDAVKEENANDAVSEFVDQLDVPNTLPVKLVNLLENEELSDTRLVTRVENEPLSVTRLDTLVENDELSVTKFVTLVEKEPEAVSKFVVLEATDAESAYVVAKLAVPTNVSMVDSFIPTQAI
jgi:hypothetical protein